MVVEAEAGTAAAAAAAAALVVEAEALVAKLSFLRINSRLLTL